MGGDGARRKDWVRARGHHLCLRDTFSILVLIDQKKWPIN